MTCTAPIRLVHAHGGTTEELRADIFTARAEAKVDILHVARKVDTLAKSHERRFQALEEKTATSHPNIHYPLTVSFIVYAGHFFSLLNNISIDEVITCYTSPLCAVFAAHMQEDEVIRSCSIA